MNQNPIERWHRIVDARDLSGLDDLLAEDVVFHSPVVHSPQRGRELTNMYLTAALSVLGDGFHYVREVVGERDAVLEFVTEIDGIHVNGVDLVRWNDDGRIVDFKVMVRPLKAINLLHRKMGEMLESLK
ncbi:MAG: nuclear transport factor 2 family protein [Candidatus Rokuibacteriota bacterium]